MEHPSWVYKSVTTVKSINKFLNHLNIPKLQNKKELIEEIIHTYNKAEASDFVKMQLFNDLLEKIDVKLKIKTVEMKKGGESCRFQWAMESLQKNLGSEAVFVRFATVRKIPNYSVTASDKSHGFPG